VLENLEWRGKEKWSVADRYVWNVDTMESEEVSSSPVKGYVKEYENLIFLKVLNAGHMVPMNQPAVSLEMMTTFLYSGSFRTFKQELEGDLPSSNGDGDGDEGDVVMPCSDEECPVCVTETVPFIPPTQSNNNRADNKEIINNDNILTVTTTAGAFGPLEQKLDSSSEASPPSPQKNHKLLVGLLLGTMFGCVASAVTGRVRRHYFEDGGTGYTISATVDHDNDGFWDERKGYSDNPESSQKVVV